MLRATRVGFLGLLCFGVTSAALAQMAAKLGNPAFTDKAPAVSP